MSSCRLLGHHRHPVLVVIRSEGGGGGGGWKLADIDSGAAQERICSWLLKARTLLAEVASPLMKPGQRGKHATDKDPGDIAVEEEIFMASEITVNRDTPDGMQMISGILLVVYGAIGLLIFNPLHSRSVQDERFDGAEDAEDIRSACPIYH
ncbi:hypothetical protein ZIOFF_014798 [Zingiber officinale]|uniref:Uncharacterized protein n=1 Tax=Zingiber officinale TaxID=94328 RepID=A0A8J5HTM0_ZINOF|nr:hypothetical protein ZIOFF_014798 [Zingiber officinale]